jgi:hypothetical protein
MLWRSPPVASLADSAIAVGVHFLIDYHSHFHVTPSSTAARPFAVELWRWREPKAEPW